MLKKLLTTPHEKRDEKWVAEFTKAVADAPLYLLSPDPQEGPDGFPYLMTSTEGEGETEVMRDLIAWSATKGVGIVINPQTENPDFVFTYGMVWNFATRGEFLSDAVPRDDKKQIVLFPEQQLFAGKPSENFWPKPARNVFKEFLLQQGIIQGRVILLAEKENGPMDLAFSLESISEPPEEEWDGILEAFSWFFPRHYSLALLSENSITGVEFDAI